METIKGFTNILDVITNEKMNQNKREVAQQCEINLPISSFQSGRLKRLKTQTLRHIQHGTRPNIIMSRYARFCETRKKVSADAANSMKVRDIKLV